jgi:pyruvyltransferase
MKEKNFGDMLTHALLEHYGYKTYHADVKDSGLVGVGSILGNIPSNYSGIILGAGFMWKEDHADFSNAKILALRGQLTWIRTNCPKNVVLGDPGLLSANLLKSMVEKEYSLGIVPHYVDKDNIAVHRLKSAYPGDVHLIDVQDEPRIVIKEIAKCKNILSSSLHGLVTADSMLIPNRWLVLSDKILGEGFKFMDYYSAFGEVRTPIKISGNEDLNELLGYMTPPSPEVNEKINSLDKLFLRLDSFLCKD